MAVVGILGQGGGKTKSIADKLSYTGTMLYSLKFMDGVLYHLFILESSGTLTVTGSITGDVCLIGGGGLGYARGGGGWYVNNYTSVSVASGSITIGAGATAPTVQAGTTSAFGNSANGGYSGGHATYPANGSCGGGGGYSNPPGTGQGTTTRPFGSSDMLPQAGGGGGLASQTNNYKGGNGGSNGGNGTAATSGGTTPGNGGVCGGGGSTNEYGQAGGMNGSDGAGSSKGTGGGFGYGGGSGGFSPTNNGAGTPGAVMIRIAA